jgi:hypothetical protein
MTGYGPVNWYDPEINFVLNHPDGMVGRMLKRRAKKFILVAKEQAGKKTGALRKAIGVREHLRSPAGQYMKVGVGPQIPYAYIHHEGTRAHVIVPKRAQMLVFPNRQSSVKGALIFAHKVHHPGTAPNKFLSDNARMFLID